MMRLLALLILLLYPITSHASVPIGTFNSPLCECPECPVEEIPAFLLLIKFDEDGVYYVLHVGEWMNRGTLGYSCPFGAEECDDPLLLDAGFATKTFKLKNPVVEEESCAEDTGADVDDP